MHALLLALILIISPPAQAEDYCSSAETTHDLNECGMIDIEMEDRAMTIIYEKLIAMAKKEDSNFMRPGMSREESLREAQRAWIKFRNENCQYEALHYGYDGTIAGQIQRGCVAGMIKERGLELQKMVKFNEQN